MRSINRVTILGNVARDPELKATTGGQNVANFAIATNRTWKDKDGEPKSLAEFHSVICWGDLAEIASKNVKKGDPLYVEGYLKTRSWDSDGKKMYRTEIVVENLILLPKHAPKEDADTTEHVPDVKVADLPF